MTRPELIAALEFARLYDEAVRAPAMEPPVWVPVDLLASEDDHG